MSDIQIAKTCCFAGHKKIPDDKVEFVEQELRRAIDDALKAGYMHFICGFDDGAPLLFAKIVAEKRSENPSIELEAAIAYRNKVSSLQKNAEARKLLGACSIIGVHGEKYSKDAIVIRNRFMVESSGRLIAVYDGRMKGGTVMALRFAHIFKREIREIRI